MGHMKAWVLPLGVITLVLFAFWLAPWVFPDLGWRLDELNQVAGIASLAVAVATLVVALWPIPHKASGTDDGDAVDLIRVRTTGAVKGKTGPAGPPGRDRIRMRGIRAGGDVIGKQTGPPTGPSR